MSHRPLSYYIGQHAGWVRVFGYGVAWKSVTMPVWFSERYGHVKWFRVGEWKWRFVWRVYS